MPSKNPLPKTLIHILGLKVKKRKNPTNLEYKDLKDFLIIPNKDNTHSEHLLILKEEQQIMELHLKT
jgi:predicted transglutaminase-like protease